jgi:hypothetical protein
MRSSRRRLGRCNYTDDTEWSEQTYADDREDWLKAGTVGGLSVRLFFELRPGLRVFSWFVAEGMRKAKLDDNFWVEEAE